MTKYIATGDAETFKKGDEVIIDFDHFDAPELHNVTQNTYWAAVTLDEMALLRETA